MPDPTRDAEIEALAERIFVENVRSWHEDHDMSGEESASDALLLAQQFIEMRTAWRERRAAE